MGVAIIGQEGAIIGEVGVAITGQEGAIIGEVGVATTGQEGAIIGEVEVGVAIMAEDEVGVADTTQIGKGMVVTTDGRGKEEEEGEEVTRGNPKEALIGALKQTIGESEQIYLIITEWEEEEEGEIMFSFVVYNKKWT